MSDISHGMGAGTSGEDARRADLERKASSLAERARTRLGATVEPIAERAREFAEEKNRAAPRDPAALQRYGLESYWAALGGVAPGKGEDFLPI